MKQIKGYITNEDYKRLQEIKKEYRFRSIYQIMQYLVKSFLRVADPKNDASDDLLPDEIKEMFREVSEEKGGIDFYQ